MTVILAGLLLSGSGFLVPRATYSVGHAFIAAIIYVVVYLLLRLATRRSSQLPVVIYVRFVTVCALAFVAAAMVASLYGSGEPVWLISRFAPRDDYVVYSEHIIPAVPEPGLGIGDATTNAPLFWFTNVLLQRFALDLAKETDPISGIQLNMVIGAVVAFLIALTVSSAVPAIERSADLRRTLASTVVSCPWLVASSIIFIRDIWVYAVFAGLLFVIVRTRSAGATRRVSALALATLASCGLMLLLRGEMIPIAAALGLAGMVGARQGKRANRRQVVGLVALAALGMGSFFAFDGLERASIYSDWAKEDVEVGLLVGLMGDSLIVRAVIQAIWAPVNPLPRVLVSPGAVYHLAKTLMPIWTIALLLTTYRVHLHNSIATDRGSAQSWARGDRLLIGWILLTMVAVGATSGETRHTYVVIPAVVLLAFALMARTEPTSFVRRTWLESAGYAVALGGVCLIVNLVVFGFEGLLTYQ